LPGFFGQPLGDDARDIVIGAARRVGHHVGDRLGRERLLGQRIVGSGVERSDDDRCGERGAEYRKRMTIGK
jgi:hypothetical protein